MLAAGGRVYGWWKPGVNILKTAREPSNAL